MQTKRKWRNRALALTVLTFLVGLPELASAQQSGLFPNAPIRRQRTPCNQEDSVYKLYRQQYYGYHPTCWRRFPDGWGCPSPEGPDRAKSFRDIKPQPPETPGDDDAGNDQMNADDRGAPANDKPATRPSLPPVPENSKPLFQPDNPDQNSAPNGNGAGAGGQANPPRTSYRGNSLNDEVPRLLRPTERPRNMRVSNARQRDRDERDDRPMLAMSEENDQNRIDAGDLEPIDGNAGAMSVTANDGPTASSNEATSQGRKGGVLSSLFGGTGWSWRRR